MLRMERALAHLVLVLLPLVLAHLVLVLLPLVLRLLLRVRLRSRAM
jgi:hypothetical protein